MGFPRLKGDKQFTEAQLQDRAELNKFILAHPIGKGIVSAILEEDGYHHNATKGWVK